MTHTGVENTTDVQQSIFLPGTSMLLSRLDCSAISTSRRGAQVLILLGHRSSYCSGCSTDCKKVRMCLHVFNRHGSSRVDCRVFTCVLTTGRRRCRSQYCSGRRTNCNKVYMSMYTSNSHRSSGSIACVFTFVPTTGPRGMQVPILLGMPHKL